MEGMEDMEAVRPSPGWEPGSAGLRESREGVNEHTGLSTAVRSFTPSLDSCLPPTAAPNLAPS